MSSSMEPSNDKEEEFIMPAEWSPHAACLILYPHNAATFCLPRAQQQVCRVVQAIATDGEERVLLCFRNDQQAQQVRDQLGTTSSQILVTTCPSNDTWARDTGPTFCVGPSSLRGLDWDFNAYGGLYEPYNLDQEVARTMCNIAKKELKLPLSCQSIPLVLEGGSIHVDGQGTMITTKECLLHPNRNPTKSQSEIQEVILNATGCRKVIWLPHGLAFDEDTNGHVDNWACFVRPGHVVLAWTDNEQGDPINYARCRIALDLLEHETDAQGRSLTVHKLYLPSPLYYTQQDVESLQISDTTMDPRIAGARMAASYVNFYIANRAVICPQFGDDKADARALQTLSELFSDRKIVGVPSRDILIGGGNIHCITQQVPALPDN